MILYETVIRALLLFYDVQLFYILFLDWIISRPYLSRLSTIFYRIFHGCRSAHAHRIDS